ncbi:MAG: hypothetical protein M1832_001008 [Thelocarpon impressellum]|nr:MAG: hypothetical protein M1832_001008 [Thelocarpon impressellum]
MAGTTDYEFQGWLGLDKSATEGKMQWGSFEPKKWEETDIDIKVTHCGICGSDLHTLRSGWGPTRYPCCVGHEIVGTAVRVGSQVKKGIKVGDRVGVGAQSAACLKADCEQCSIGQENYCPLKVDTYNSLYRDGSKSYGGYANYHRTMGHFAFKIPDALRSEDAAPMLCGGLTMYSPLKNNGAGPGKKVGIVGVGGLGHMGVQFAKALGCDKVVAISRTSGKKADALHLGADDFIATDEDKNWSKKHSSTLDLIVSTVSSPSMPLSRYFHLLRTHGQLIQVGAPDDKIPAFNVFSLVMKGLKLGGSSIGSPKEIEEMLDLAVKKNIRPWVQVRPMKDANQVIQDMEEGQARYRYVLVNEKHATPAKL